MELPDRERLRRVGRRHVFIARRSDCYDRRARHTGHAWRLSRDEHRKLGVWLLLRIDVNHDSGQRDEHRDLCVFRLFQTDVNHDSGQCDEHRGQCVFRLFQTDGSPYFRLGGMVRHLVWRQRGESLLLRPSSVLER